MSETGSAASLTPGQIALFFESQSLFERAQALTSRRKYAQAEPLFVQAIEKRKQGVGESDASLGLMLDALGVLHLSQNKIEQALECFAGALDILEKAYYAGHAKLAPVLDHQADCLIKQGNLEQAETVLKRVLDIKDKTLTAEHRSTLDGVVRLSRVSRKLAKFADAEAILNKYFKNVDTPLGPAETFRFEQALLYQAQGKSTEAEAAYSQAIDGFARRNNFDSLAEALESFGDFLDKAGRAEQARNCRERADCVRQEAPSWYHMEDIFPATLLRA